MIELIVAWYFGMGAILLTILDFYDKYEITWVTALLILFLWLPAFIAVMTDDVTP